MEGSSEQPIIIASRSDQASYNIAESLVRGQGFSLEKTIESSGQHIYRSDDAILLLGNKDCIYIEPSDLPIHPKKIIFVSKHRSAQNQAALTVHTTGNFGNETKFGGNPGELAFVEPNLLRSSLLIMKSGVDHAGIPIEVTMEASHHGPTSFDVPVCFLEIGSTPKEWNDPRLGEIVASATIAALRSTDRALNTVGFGGTHYPAKHTKVNLDPTGKYAVGHIVPKHVFEKELSPRMLRQTFDKTTGGCRTALVDWDGLKGAHRKWLLDQLARWDVEVIRR